MGSLMPPLALDDAMLDRLTNAAALLPANARDHFMRSVANRIADLHHPPGVAELEVAINFVLGTRGVSVGRAAFGKNTSRPGKNFSRTRADRHFRTIPGGVSK